MVVSGACRTQEPASPPPMPWILWVLQGRPSRPLAPGQRPGRVAIVVNITVNGAATSTCDEVLLVCNELSWRPVPVEDLGAESSALRPQPGSSDLAVDAYFSANLGTLLTAPRSPHGPGASVGLRSRTFTNWLRRSSVVLEGLKPAPRRQRRDSSSLHHLRMHTIEPSGS